MVWSHSQQPHSHVRTFFQRTKVTNWGTQFELNGLWKAGRKPNDGHILHGEHLQSLNTLILKCGGGGGATSTESNRSSWTKTETSISLHQAQANLAADQQHSTFANSVSPHQGFCSSSALKCPSFRWLIAARHQSVCFRHKVGGAFSCAVRVDVDVSVRW